MNELNYQRWGALGLLLLILLALVLLVFMPLISTAFEYQQQKIGLAFQIERTHRVIAKKQQVTNQINQIKQQYQQQNYFSSASTSALASAELQKIIKTTILDAGGQLISTQVLPSKKETNFNRVTVKVRMSGDSEVLRNMLYEFESFIPLMVVNQLDIRPVRGKRNRKTRKIQLSNKLTINFQVTGFMRKVT